MTDVYDLGSGMWYATTYNTTADSYGYIVLTTETIIGWLVSASNTAYYECIHQKIESDA